jgi:antitoxin CptB
MKCNDGQLRWRCRRGMLELDLVLGRFLERYLAALPSEQKQVFGKLLDLPDPELWDLIQGLTQSDNAELVPVLALLRAA